PACGPAAAAGAARPRAGPRLNRPLNRSTAGPTCSTDLTADPTGGAVGYLTESPTWKQRRRRRQRVTMAVIVLLVVAVGVVAYGYREQWFGPPEDDVVVGTVPTCPTASPAPLTAADVHVNVYNSTSRSGLAASVAKALHARSFVVETVANDPLHADVKATALVRFGPDGAKAAALVQAQVAKAVMKQDTRKGAGVDLVLGQAFRGLAAPSTPTTTTPAPTPSVRCTPAATPSSPAPGTPSDTSSPSPSG
ncbi:MAG TPA: LytR C-terminal domain-containing protein, partial [Actinomycetales bacterium]|nr:LytR C-terminal domain-containing protein [Actinomycetales bacterium]